MIVHTTLLWLPICMSGGSKLWLAPRPLWAISLWEPKSNFINLFIFWLQSAAAARSSRVTLNTNSLAWKNAKNCRILHQVLVMIFDKTTSFIYTQCKLWFQRNAGSNLDFWKKFSQGFQEETSIWGNSTFKFRNIMISYQQFCHSWYFGKEKVVKSCKTCEKHVFHASDFQVSYPASFNA